MLVARVSVLVADTIVIGVTWIRLRQQVREFSGLKMGTRISAVMLADGNPFYSVIGVAKGDLRPHRKRVLYVGIAPMILSACC